MANSAKMNGRNYIIIPQGSYQNNTNVRNESDVDICVCYQDVYHANFFYAPGESITSMGDTPSQRVFAEDRQAIGAALRATFAPGISEGSNAFEVHSNTSRVDADVVAAWRFRGYSKNENTGEVSYREGVTYWTSSGKQVINFPEQHHRNGVEKNNRTGRAFKRTVRIVKRMRYLMLAREVGAADGVASFFIESALYNFPDSVYTDYRTWKETVRDVLTRMLRAEGASEWVEISGFKWLFKPNYGIPAKWTIEQMQAFAREALRLLDQ